ncbi:alpha/beta hydrolase [Microbulbifer sp. SA54]|uniref:alpha/beta hydrolase n=1 Tax=Microbulbifer sp. SA54 TaxID=3401577 RepID=UPI003AAD352D
MSGKRHFLRLHRTLWLILFAALVPPQSASATEMPAALTIHRDIPWAEVNGRALTSDIFTPLENAPEPRPVVVIYHGGGWLINSNRIMDSAARYIASHGDFVVANMNYRLLGDNANSTNMDDIVEDALGGLLWVKENIARYGGDPSRIAVTGDSAGGHLSAMVLLAARNLSSAGFSPESLAFTPTYLPGGKTPEDIAEHDALAVQAAVLSYGAFDLYSAALEGFESPDNFFWQMGGAKARGMFGAEYNAQQNPELYKAVSPVYLVPKATEYKLPPVFAHVGSKDTTTPPQAVEQFVDKLRSAGQDVEYKVYPGKNHAFLESGCNEYLGNCFDEDAPAALDDMIQFIQRVLTGRDS